MSPGAEAYAHWRAHGGIADLTARTKLRLTGADRVRYLNGQVTAHVLKLGLEAALPACVTTAKGKLCADVQITATAEALLVDAEAALRETLLARLERYVVADDVVIEDVTESLGLLHFFGGEKTDSTVGTERRRARRFGPAGVDLWLPVADRAAALASSPDPASPRLLDAELLESIRLEYGVPRWGRELGEETLPPEAGLDRTHIDYAKGCYIGQEVISRLKSVGHVNRQLTAFISEEGALTAGSTLLAADEPQSVLGRLTSAGWSFALAKPMALGYLKRGAPTGPLLAQPPEPGAAPIPVRVAPLPVVPCSAS